MRLNLTISVTSSGSRSRVYPVAQAQQTVRHKKADHNARLFHSYELTITQQQLLQMLLGDLQAQCKPLELCHQRGNRT